jgi:cell division protease FtsH
VLVVVPILGVAMLGLFFLVWQFLTPAEHHQPVPYSDFMMEVRAGKVEDIKIHDREIVFRVRGENGHGIVKETIGPVPDQALFDSLKPTDPNVPPPKVFFEK